MKNLYLTILLLVSPPAFAISNDSQVFTYDCGTHYSNVFPSGCSPVAHKTLVNPGPITTMDYDKLKYVGWALATGAVIVGGVIIAPDIAAAVAAYGVSSKVIAATTATFEKVMPIIERGAATALRRHVTAGVSALMFMLFHKEDKE